MAYKWKPNKTQRREFAEKMKDQNEQAAYYQRKDDKAEKKRAGSQFDYNSAGGEYIPTEAQYKFTMSYQGQLTMEQNQAFHIIQYGHSCKEKVHHDFIHVVNEMIRSA